jgi:hypothetical protein
VTYVCILLGQEVLSPGLCFSIFTIPVQALSIIGSYTHNHTNYSVCSHGNQHVCFNPTYSSREQRLEVLGFNSIIRGGIRDHINCTQVFNPDKPVSVFLMYMQPQTKIAGCGGLAWERAFMLNGKYMCLDPHGRLCGGAGWHFCTYRSCVSGATWQKSRALNSPPQRNTYPIVHLAILIL